jgi:hypothetical protein
MRITTYQQLPDSQGWANLFEHCDSHDYFSSRRWYEHFIATVVGRDGSPLFLAAESEPGRPAAVFPLWRRQTSGLFGVQRLDSLSNYYSCLYQPLLCGDRERASRGLEALIEHLARVENRWTRIELRPLPADAWYVRTIVDGFAAHGHTVEQYGAFGNWYLECANLRFEDYFNSRRKKLRSTVRGKLNQLREQFTLDIRIVQDAAATTDALAAYERVYAVSWKQPEPYVDFIPGLMRMLAEEQKLRLGVLSLDGKAVAAQLWFVANRVAHIYKLAYDPDYSQYSVGTILTMDLMQHMLDVDHVECVDFLSGDDEYKQQWMSHRRERIAIEIINRRKLAGHAILLVRRLRRLRSRFRATA